MSIYNTQNEAWKKQNKIPNTVHMSFIEKKTHTKKAYLHDKKSY